MLLPLFHEGQLPIIDLSSLGIAGLTSLHINGQEFLSKEEVLHKVFKDMKNAALRSFASRRKIKSILATEDARSFLEKTLGKRRGGHYLMKRHDVEILISEKRRLDKSDTKPKEENVINPSAGGQNLPTSCKQILPTLVPNRDGNTRDGNNDTSMQSLPSTSTEPPQIDVIAATSGKTDGTSASVTFEREKNMVVSKMQRRKLPLLLNESVEKQLIDFSIFYSLQLNPMRPSLHMSKNTVERHEKRVREFLDYVERKYERPASFDDCLDISIAASYIDERTGAMSKGTSANHVQTLIVLAKYVLRDSKHRGNWERVKEVADLRHLQSQLQVCPHSG